METSNNKIYKLFSILLVIFLSIVLFSGISEAAKKTTYYLDSDTDTYGDPNIFIEDTSPPPGYVEDNTDCNDSNPAINPGVAEICDGVDNNCDGNIDEGGVCGCIDADVDGYDDSACGGTDCDDNNPAINPGVAEICDGLDNNCDGEIDEGCCTGNKTMWFRDVDADGYGDMSDNVCSNNQPDGYVTLGTDCNDTDPAINPGATEICDGVDNNCDGNIDEGCVTYYEDSDGDMYGNVLVSQVATSQPPGYVLDSTDCDDTDPAINPGAVEVPDDGIDNNCDGLQDNTYYEDSDGDMYGNVLVYQVATSQPPGYVLDSTDCDDTNPDIYPGAPEIWDNGIDEDCDGSDSVTFMKVYGGTGIDEGSSIDQTTDGGYVILGKATSFGAGSNDMYLIKTNSLGGEEWSQTYGGTGDDYGNYVIQASDGGYALIGRTAAGGYADVYFVKTDNLGNVEWSRTYGGANWDEGFCIQQTTDGGYILSGTTRTFDSGGDIYLIKTDSLGIEEWSMIYGEVGFPDYNYSVRQTTDGGYILSGSTKYLSAGSTDFYALKVDSLGNEEWSKTFGDTGWDYGQDIRQTTDGGYIFIGRASPPISSGSFDMWLIKMDALGNEEWNQTFGGMQNDFGDSVVQTSDGGYAITGQTQSSGSGSQDAYLIKTDSLGNEIWSKTYGGTGLERMYRMIITSDGGFAMIGFTNSFGAGSIDYYFIKTDANGDVDPNHIIYYQDSDGDGFGNAASSVIDKVQPPGYVTDNTDCDDTDPDIYPGAVEVHNDGIDQDCDGSDTISFDKTFGGEYDEMGIIALYTSDGGYIIGGSTATGTIDGYQDVYVVKTDNLGNETWTYTYGDTYHESIYDMHQTSDGGYILSGRDSTSPTFSDANLIKLDSNGNELWTQVYQDGMYAYGLSVQETNDGGFILIDDFYSGTWQTLLIKTDAAGNRLWSMTYSERLRKVQQTIDGGYIMYGTVTYQDPASPLYLLKTDASGAPQWSKTFSKGNNQFAIGLELTSDYGYILLAEIEDFVTGIKHISLIKTDASGNEEWSQVFGSNSSPGSVQQTSDGGYIIIGSDQNDMYLIKTDSLGIEEWSKHIGGDETESGSCVQEVIGKGYILGGSTHSFGAGDLDMYLVKVDSAGNLYKTYYYDNDLDGFGDINNTIIDKEKPAGYLYDNTDCNDNDPNTYPGAPEFCSDGTDNNCDGIIGSYCQISNFKTFGGANDDYGYYVEQTSDGGYILCGVDVTSSIYIRVVKTDADRNEEWSQEYTYGSGSYYSASTTIKQTPGGGYIILGTARNPSNGNSYDFLLIKIDASGTVEWEQTYGGTGNDFARSLDLTSDGGYILTGDSISFSTDYDMYLVKTDSLGNEEWSYNYTGGNYQDVGRSVQQTTDGGYIVFGNAYAGSSGNIFYLVKTDPLGIEEWNQTYINTSVGYSVQQTTDGGYILAGSANSDAYLIKTDSLGNEEWSQSYGGTSQEAAMSVQQTTDGGYILLGGTNSDIGSYGGGSWDMYLVKTDSLGTMEWEVSYGGFGTEFGRSVKQTTDGGYILLGDTNSYGAGGLDMYLIKTGADGIPDPL